MPDTVTLHTAYSWDCPSCKKRNYADGQTPPSDIVEDGLRNHLNLEAWESIPTEADGQWVCIPDSVKCDGCSLEFFTDDEHEEST